MLEVQYQDVGRFGFSWAISPQLEDGCLFPVAFCAHILGVSFFVSKFLLLRSTQVSLNCCCSVAELCLTLWPHGLQDARFPCPSPSPGACSDLCPLNRWCHPTISPSPAPFSFAFNLGLWPTLKWLGFCGGSDGKESTCNAGDPPRFDPWVLERGVKTLSTILAWRIPWTEEPGRLQSMGS